MSDKTKYWLIGGGAFCFLAIVYCMTKRQGISPVAQEMMDDVPDNSYLTYNMPGFGTNTPSVGNSGGYNFGDTNINIGGYNSNNGGNGQGAGCCDPCAKPNKTFANFQLASVPPAPAYMSSYVAPKYNSVLPFDWGNYTCDFGDLTRALQDYAASMGMTYREFLANQRRQANGTFAMNLAPKRAGESDVDAIFRHGKQYTAEMACECIRTGNMCGHYLTPEILRTAIGEPVVKQDDPSYMLAVPLSV